MTPTTPRLDAIQVLRAIAAGLVVVIHAIETYARNVGPIPAAWHDLGLGDLGVKLFFVISGFIIARAALELPAGPASAYRFAQRRLWRIVPLYWLATWLYAAQLLVQGRDLEPWQLIASMAFIPYTAGPGLPMLPVLGQGWTLNFEMLFYAAMTAALLLPAKARILAVGSAMLAFWLCVPKGTGGGVDITLLADHRLAFFVAGLVAARLPRPPFDLPFGVAMFAAAYSLAIPLLYDAVDPAPVEWLMRLAQFVGCFAAVAFAAHARPATVPVRWLTLAGDGSYSTYLFHGFLIGASSRAIAALGLPVSAELYAVGMLIACSALGVLLYRFLERPVLAYATHSDRNPRPAQRAPEAPMLSRRSTVADVAGVRS